MDICHCQIFRCSVVEEGVAVAAAVAAVAAVVAEPVAEDGEEAVPAVVEEEIQGLVVEHHQVKLKSAC